MKKTILIALSILSFSAFADEGFNQSSERTKPIISAEMKAAFESCKSLGKPHESAFDDCMKSKGFEKPMHHKFSPEMKAAIDDCKKLGKPHESAFDDCMKSKGFEKPIHHIELPRPKGRGFLLQ